MRTTGTVLVCLGVGIWAVYAVGRYLLGWDITDRQFLPYHLATILPGMVLRYHRFFFQEVPSRFARPGKRTGDQSFARVKNDSGSFLKIAIVLNNFIHDLSTGLWASSLIVIYFLDRKTRSLQELTVITALQEVMRTLFWLGACSIAVILVTGGFRLLYYKNENTGEDGETKKNLLIVKHVLFTFVFLGGTYFAYLRGFQGR